MRSLTAAAIRTAIPGKVEAVRQDGTGYLVDVQPLVRRVDLATRETLTPPIVPDVPVLFPRTARGGLTWAIEPGDGVYLVVSDRAIDSWYVGGGNPADPVELRTHDLTDAVAIPGLWWRDGGIPVVTEGAALEYDGLRVHVLPGGKVRIGTATVELLDLVDRLIAALQTAVVQTSLGPQPLDPATQATLSQIKAELATIKG